MRALPHLQIDDKWDGIAQYTVSSRPGWLTLGWLDVLLWVSLVALYLSEDLHLIRSYVALTCLLALWAGLKRRTRRRESLLVIQAFGAQLSSQMVLELHVWRDKTLLIPVSGRSILFIPMPSIQEILLLEGIQGWSVIWYLAIIQKDTIGSKIHVIFKKSLPRLHILRQVWQGSRYVLGMDGKATEDSVKGVQR